MDLVHRPIDFVTDMEYILERHCRINYACDCPWKRKMPYEDYRREWFGMPAQMQGFLNPLRDSAKGSKAIAEIIEDGAGTTVAYFWVSFEETESGFCYAEVQDIYVEEVFREAGIASQLMAYAETKAKENGAKVIRSGTGIENTKSIAMHGKLGYYQYRCEFEKLL